MLQQITMIQHILFLQGGSDKADHDADASMVASLEKSLDTGYIIHYPILNNDNTPDFGRSKQIGHHLSVGEDGVIVVTHSLGGSMLLKYLSEHHVTKKIAGIFLIAAPFWTGDEDWVQPLKLRSDFAQRLDQDIPLFFYHCRDDEEVPFDHFLAYKEKLPWATFRDRPKGGHRFGEDLAMVGDDIKSVLSVKQNTYSKKQNV